MLNMDDRPGRPHTVEKISVSLSKDVLDWVLREKGDLKVSTFINQVLRETMYGSLKPSSYSACDELGLIDRRLKRLEEDVHQLLEVRSLTSGKLGKTGHVSILSTRPKEVFGQLINIKNVSAKNAMAVYEELVPFMQGRDYVDRKTVIDELFPRTRSAITNDINYWYNACRGVLGRLVEEGSVVRLKKGKYKWIGDKKP